MIPATILVVLNWSPKLIVPAAPTRASDSLIITLVPPPPPPEIKTLLIPVILPLASTTICGTAVELP